jgi:NDP-sugar pyrophosphorylase family protein
MIESAGIIAAGEGLRFKEAGVRVHKPLIPIAGFPLIGHRLRQFVESGIQGAVIIFNEGQQDCADWVRKHFPAMDLHILIKSTRSSFESFWRVGRALGPGRHLISTVDAICSSDDWHKMLNPRSPSLCEILLGVTSFVHDEKPLWVRTAPGSLEITEIGGGAHGYATAGLYGVHEGIFEKTLREDISSLRVFLRELLREGFPVRAVPLADVIDVDTVDDIHLAEKFLSRRRRSS